MSPIPDTCSQEGRREIRERLLAANDEFIAKIPKVELHVHIEGTLTPQLRWQLAKRNGMEVRMDNDALCALQSVEEVERAYDDVISSAQLSSYAHCPPSEVPATFFEAYYSGCEVLKTRQDFFDLAFDYFQRAASMNVRYCEVFFDPQSHTSRRVPWIDFMEGLREAQNKAATELNVKSGWIMCFLRDSPLESALEHYREAMAYKDIIIGFGLDSNETNHPPSLYDDIFTMARKDGFKITAHCDVGQKDTHKNIRHVASALGGYGTDRVDHGLNAADLEELTRLILERDIGMTICPWAYLRRWTYQGIAERIQVLLDAGVKVCISSDSPAYMDSSWLLHNLLITKKMCNLSDADILSMMETSIEMTWATEEIKAELLQELHAFRGTHLHVTP
ncbi:adenosine deaminase [Xylariaceae sp. FL1019]|nr:adenosine deaminase [Xylariaceae sp. FL1019]